MNDALLADAFTILDQAMWAQRGAVEAVRFRLLEARLVLDAEEARFVPHVVAEATEALRGMRSPGGGSEEMSVPPSWWSLLDDAPEPWRTAFADHRRALEQACREIAEAVQDPRLAELLDPGVWKALGGEPVGADVGSPQPDDLDAAANAVANRLDAVVCRAALGALSPTRRRSLVDFLA
ncbi:MAG: hypothetical protein HKN46_00370 [Acidimicrobiia bacterium]|nr:hypothetical protein [Acidimicrobiia bacterium]